MPSDFHTNTVISDTCYLPVKVAFKAVKIFHDPLATVLTGSHSLTRRFSKKYSITAQTNPKRFFKNQKSPRIYRIKFLSPSLPGTFILSLLLFIYLFIYLFVCLFVCLFVYVLCKYFGKGVSQGYSILYHTLSHDQLDFATLF